MELQFDEILMREIDKEELSAVIEEVEAESDVAALIASSLESGSPEKLAEIVLLMEEMLEKTEGPVRAFGLYKGEAAVGYVALSDYETVSPEIQIALKEECRRRGIGYWALRAVIGEAFAREDVAHLVYRVRADNLPSIALVEKCGGKLIEFSEYWNAVIKRYHIFRPTV